MQNAKFKIQNCVTLIIILILLGSLLLPLVSLAGTYEVDGETVTYKGLVPCGKSEETLALGESPEVANPCQFCHFFVVFRAILDFVLKLVIVIAVLMLTVGGFLFFFAGGSPAAMERAKKILTSTAIGLVIIFAAWMIINTIFMAIGVADWTGLKEGWFSIECSIKPFVEKEKEELTKQKKNEIEQIVTKMKTDPDEITAEDLVLLGENRENLTDDQIKAIEIYGEQETDPEEKDLAINISTETEEEEPEEKIAHTVTIHLINSASEKSCYEVCKDQGEGFLCESVGLNKAVDDGQMWDIVSRGKLIYQCGKKDVESKGSKGCMTTILKRWGLGLYCPKAEEEKQPPQWTRCKCVKTEWR